MYSDEKKRAVLKSVFGHDAFRSLQENAIDAILQRRDLLMILPTGGGKSLCYQLPSILMNGVTVVISPLLALMHDQVTALMNLGISAGMITSMQSPDEVEETYRQLENREFKLVYVSPERFKGGRFINILSQINVNFFVIDEAHCVSEWGHEFREDYRRLDLLRKNFPGIGIAAFTATATKKVQKDITAHLKLREPEICRGTVFRENMIISSSYRSGDGRTQLLDIIENHPGENGIVYCFTRNAAESLAVFLQKQGIKARAYHAGLSAEIRQFVYEDFIHDEINIVVATVAFGMGINKSNIRFVIHASLPKTMENYYQEIGRAGRDGLPSRVYLLFSIADMMQRKSLIEQLDESPYKTLAFDKLDAMVKYAESQQCRHRLISTYFEDQHPISSDNCQTHCDNCFEMLTPAGAEKEHIDITREAQMFLSAVYRTEQRFGANYIIDILRGSRTQKIQDNRHENLSVYGIGKDHSKTQWHVISQRLQELETLHRGEFQELIIRPEGFSVLKKETGIVIRKDRFLQSNSAIYPKKSMPALTLSKENSTHFDKLKMLRTKIAKEEQVPAYIVFNDKTLIEMAEKLPVTKEDMLNIGGIGGRKYDRYGSAFIQLCRELAGT